MGFGRKKKRTPPPDARQLARKIQERVEWIAREAEAARDRAQAGKILPKDVALFQEIAPELEEFGDLIEALRDPMDRVHQAASGYIQRSQGGS